jgi:hypothetical protein
MHRKTATKTEKIIKSGEKKVAFVIPFFGEWPHFTELFLIGCSASRKADFFFISENSPSVILPKNSRHVKMPNAEIKKRIENSTKVQLGGIPGHKLCDFRPFFGLAFEDHLKSYAYWGYCDIDMMFGDIDKLLEDQLSGATDIFSAHAHQFVGHCTFFRNCPSINQLGFEISNLERLLQSPVAEHTDEERFSQVLAKHPEVCWVRPEPLDKELEKPFCRHAITFSFGGRLADARGMIDPVVTWRNGKLQMDWGEDQQAEILYVHFMGTKHPWHWPKSFRIQGHNEEPHTFSKLGYGRVKTPKDLSKWHFRTLYLWQYSLLRIKNIGGAVLKKIFPPQMIRKIRKKIGV